jgi:hypothetical protein
MSKKLHKLARKLRKLTKTEQVEVLCKVWGPLDDERPAATEPEHKPDDQRAAYEAANEREKDARSREAWGILGLLFAFGVVDPPDLGDDIGPDGDEGRAMLELSHTVITDALEFLEG